MAENEGEVSDTRIHLERAFEYIAEAMKQAARQGDYQIASSEAERQGLVKTSVDKLSGTVWQGTDQDFILRCQWRYYDQSRPFLIQKDMNVLSLELRDGNRILRQADERYED
jgi:hypothetical protein